MKKKIFVRGPVLSQSGYGEQSRFALRALRSREDLFEVYVQPETAEKPNKFDPSGLSRRTNKSSLK